MKRIIVLFGLLAFCGCKKFLSKKADGSQETPGTAAEYQTLLDNDLVTLKSTPALGVLGSDDYVLDATALAAAPASVIGGYSWDPALYQGSIDASWTNPYQAIYQCNVVLHGLELAPHTAGADASLYRLVRSRALFDRAFHFFFLQETYGQPYRPATAATDWGIPLRLDGEALQPVVRSKVKAVFTQIVADLLEAAPGLPEAPEMMTPNRPCRPAAFALLARAALVQQDYRSAWRYADSCLSLYNTLIDYDTVKGGARPFYFIGNPEVLFQCSGVAYPVLYAGTTVVDDQLYASYGPDDLRRSLFFQKGGSAVSGMGFKGYYSPGHFIFSGCAVDEVYLIRAESRARLGSETEALADLNTLLAHRWKAGTFVPYTSSSDVLGMVLTERRKELVYRELRWSDLRRLNQEPRFAVTLKRGLGDSTRRLPPNDPRYAWKIPDVEIGLSHIEQNPQ